MAREIRWTTAFKRDHKREKRGPHGKKLDEVLRKVLGLLIKDLPLAGALGDHALGGEWSRYRDCHLKPDLVLIYGKPDDESLVLARLGSHSELFG
jgi:mRNA interferase YafQ